MLLAVIMTASLLCIPGLAESADDPYAALREGMGYVALGDSFTRGYGATADGTWKSEIGKNETDEDGKLITDNCRNVTDSIPNRIAKEFDLRSPDDIRDTTARMWPVAHDAVSVAYMLDLLGIDDGFYDEPFAHNYTNMKLRYNADLKYFGDTSSFALDGKSAYGDTGEVMSIRELLKDARLITVQLGQTDVMFRALQFGLGGVDLSKAENLPGAAKDVIKILYEKFEYFKRAFPMLLDYIKDNCVDAKVVVIGTFNPMQNVMLSDEVFLPVGSAFNLITDTMNCFYKECAEKYGFSFVDISDVDTYTTEEDVSLSKMLSMELGGEEWSLRTHPTPSGYAQIARMVIEAVNDALGISPVLPDTYIKIDLGRFEKVDYVMLGDDVVRGWTAEDHVLTVPCFNKYENLLTVAVKNDNGKVTLINYRLTYDDGYSAHRLFATNDIFGAMRGSLDFVFKSLKTIFGFFKGVFN